MHCSYFLAALIWRRPLNSVALATATHKGLKGVSDGMSAQMEVQMINKCKAQMIRKSLYNVEKPPWSTRRKKEKDNIVACKRNLMWWSVLINKILSLLRKRSFDHNSFYFCLFVHQFHASHCSTHLNLVLWPILYKIHCIGLFGLGFRTIRAWAPNFVPTKSFVIFFFIFYILWCWYCVEIKLVYLFYLSLCYFVFDSNVRICIILKLLNKY